MQYLRVGLLAVLCALSACSDDDSSPSDGGADALADSSRPDGSVDAAADAADDATTDLGTDDATTDTGTDDTGTDDTGTDDTGTDDADTDGGPTMCETSEDCGGDACFLDPGDGNRDCVDDPGDPPRNACEGIFVTCECTEDAGCVERPGGHCIAFEYRYCGGAPPPETNTCRYDECAADADCDAREGGACIPPGVGNFVATCAYGPCRTSADCDEDGICEIFDEGCGTGGGQFYCRYPDDVCSEERPCDAGGMKCVPNDDGQGTQCVPDRPRG